MVVVIVVLVVVLAAAAIEVAAGNRFMQSRGWCLLLQNRFSRKTVRRIQRHRAEVEMFAAAQSDVNDRLDLLTSAGGELYVSFKGTELRERGAAGLFGRDWRCCRE